MNLLANLALLAQEGEHAPEGASGLKIILPAVPELLYGAVSFAIIYLVLAKFAFPRLNATLDERRAAIQGKMEESEAALRDADETRRRYESQLRDTRGEANRILEEARESGETARREIIARAEAEAQAITERARAEIGAERDRVIAQLRAQVGTLSVALAGKIVGKELDEYAHRELIDSYIQELSTTN